MHKQHDEGMQGGEEASPRRRLAKRVLLYISNVEIYPSKYLLTIAAIAQIVLYLTFRVVVVVWSLVM